MATRFKGGLYATVAERGWFCRLFHKASRIGAGFWCCNRCEINWRSSEGHGG